ncbi:MAG: AbrB/MazE/SpoVT family DNA-binding domain-containing protein [Rhizobiaceae bacterium]
MRVTSKGQVTIPKDLRKLAGIEPNSDVFFGIENGKITIEAHNSNAENDNRERLRNYIESLEKLAGTVDLDGMTTDEYMIWLRGPRDDLDAH